MQDMRLPIIYQLFTYLIAINILFISFATILLNLQCEVEKLTVSSYYTNKWNVSTKHYSQLDEMAEPGRV